MMTSVVQVDLDFRLHFQDTVTGFTNDFPKWTSGIIAAARLSHKADLVSLLRDYDSQQHNDPAPSIRDHTYALLALLHLLPSCNTRQRAKLSSTELESSLLAFMPQQTSIQLFVDAKKEKHKQPSLLCLGTKDEPGSFFSSWMLRL